MESVLATFRAVLPFRQRKLLLDATNRSMGTRRRFVERNRSAPRRKRVVALAHPLCLFLLMLVTFQAPLACSSSERSAVQARSSKIAPELLKLHQEYSSHLAAASSEPFRPANPLLQIVDGRVIVDAVASGDVSVLQKDLVGLGMQQAVSFGRIVSGQLPISSIPALENLSSLNFARAAAAITQKG